MSIPVVCDSCKSQFNAPDNAGGKRTKCPTCGGIISIPARAAVATGLGVSGPSAAIASDPFAPPAPVDPTAAGEDRKKCPMCGEMIAAKAIRCRFCGEVLDASMRGIVNVPGDVSEPGWKTVRSGLKTLYYSIATIFAALVLGGIGIGIAMAVLEGAGKVDPAEMSTGMGILVLLLALVVLGACIGMLIGQILCANVPASTGARGFAIGAAICFAGYLIGSVLAGVTEERAFRSFGGLLMMCGTILFILFIRRCATYLHNPGLASSAGWCLVFGVTLFVSMVIAVMVAVLTGAFAVIGIVSLIVIICGLISIIWYLRLIRYLIASIDQRMGIR